jgi:hypothetical protein
MICIFISVFSIMIELRVREAELIVYKCFDCHAGGQVSCNLTILCGGATLVALPCYLGV